MIFLNNKIASNNHWKFAVLEMLKEIIMPLFNQIFHYKLYSSKFLNLIPPLGENQNLNQRGYHSSSFKQYFFLLFKGYSLYYFIIWSSFYSLLLWSNSNIIKGRVLFSFLSSMLYFPYISPVSFCSSVVIYFNPHIPLLL